MPSPIHPRPLRSTALALSIALAMPLAAVTVACAGRTSADAAPLSVGSPAPSLRAEAHDGTQIDLGALGGALALVYFYPKDATPGCTAEACAIRDAWTRFETAGVRVIGVSSDDLESHRAFAQEHALPFPLVADEDHQWAQAFGVETTMGMTARDSFLIGPDGRIARVYRGVDPAVHVDEVLRDVTALQNQP